MRAPDSNALLRPLGLGEILDRAVNLCVRFFVPLASIYVWYAVPLGIITYFSSQSFTRAIGHLTDATKSGHPLTSEQVIAIFQSQPSDALAGIVAALFAFFVGPLPAAALIEATTAYYLGRTSSVREAYRVAVDRYWNMLGITCLFALTAFIAYLALIIVGFVIALVFALLAAASPTVAIVLGVILGIVAAIAIAAVIIVFIFILQIAYFSCVVERVNAITAFGRSLKRAFSSVGLKRTLLIGLIYLAIALGIGLVTLAGQGLIVALTHAAIVGTIYQTAVGLATAAFTTTFMGIFYLDLRVREEGLDLQLATDRSEAPATLQA